MADVFARAYEAGVRSLVTLYDPVADRSEEPPDARAFSAWLKAAVNCAAENGSPLAVRYLVGVHPYGAPELSLIHISQGEVSMFDRVRGVNLSGWFILEPWVTPSLFAATGASNDGELQQVLGPAAYNERVREHYETFVTELDFKRMSAMGLNAVRIPLPWYAFGAQNEHESYISCIDYIDRAMEWANKYEMKVLLDLATVPGGQGDSNSSPTIPDIVADWHSSACLLYTSRCV